MFKRLWKMNILTNKDIVAVIGLSYPKSEIDLITYSFIPSTILLKFLVGKSRFG